jgi:protein gp37
MAGTTGIEWCDATFNPWWGCEKVSPACAHCYADTLSKRYAAGKQLWGAGHDFKFPSEAYWRLPLRWARTLPAKLGRRPRVFCASMADVFEERAELDEHRLRLFDLIRATPDLDWLVLTKRPEAFRDFALRLRFSGSGNDGAGRVWLADEVGKRDGYALLGGLPGCPPLPNLWAGVSIENARYTWRADVLREIPAAVRFISAEPLLGSLFKSAAPGGRGVLEPASPGEASGVGNEPVTGAAVRKPLDLTGIDWVIAGGESGPRARPSHPDWFREIRDACVCPDCLGDPTVDEDAREAGRVPVAALGAGFAARSRISAITPLMGTNHCSTCAPHPGNRTAFFFKQWGEWAPGADDYTRSGEFHGAGTWVADCMCSEGTDRMVRFGKTANGRELDGRVWDEFPASAAVPA